jgi:hypothetical protein
MMSLGINTPQSGDRILLGAAFDIFFSIRIQGAPPIVHIFLREATSPDGEYRPCQPQNTAVTCAENPIQHNTQMDTGIFPGCHGHVEGTNTYLKLLARDPANGEELGEQEVPTAPDFQKFVGAPAPEETSGGRAA